MKKCAERVAGFVGSPLLSNEASKLGPKHHRDLWCSTSGARIGDIDKRRLLRFECVIRMPVSGDEDGLVKRSRQNNRFTGDSGSIE